MSEIKALDVLRELIEKSRHEYEMGNVSYVVGFNDIADDIEAEVAERFVELPVDAEGVPVKIGDTLQLGDTRGEVVALTYCPSNGKLSWEWQCDTGDWYNTAFARHVRPRTVEDVLKELEGMRGNGATYEDVVARCSELADELRGLIGGTHE